MNTWEFWNKKYTKSWTMQRWELGLVIERMNVGTGESYLVVMTPGRLQQIRVYLDSLLEIIRNHVIASRAQDSDSEIRLSFLQKVANSPFREEIDALVTTVMLTSDEAAQLQVEQTTGYFSEASRLEQDDVWTVVASWFAVRRM